MSEAKLFFRCGQRTARGNPRAVPRLQEHKPLPEFGACIHRGEPDLQG